ncbi:MAG: hypothetical protein ACKOW9_05750 [Candidatus Paceibacterota bacterium]
MRIIKFFFILLVVFSLSGSYRAYAQITNTGFVETNIWYSKESLVEGEKVKVYTLVFNPSNKNFKGTVSFFNKATLLGKKDVTVGASTAEAISIDWVVSAGGHEMFAKITNPRFETKPGIYEEALLVNDETEKSIRTVSKKLPDVKEVKNKIDEALESGLSPIEAVKDSVTSAIPESVKKPVYNTFGQVDYLRTNAFESISKERSKVQDKIQKFEQQSKTTPEGEERDIEALIVKEQESKNQIVGSAKAPLQYVWLFILTLLGFIFQYKIIFYFLLVLAFIGVVRLIIKLLR